jgi:hypothetical protein
MRVLFGALGLLIVLAIVASVAKQQLAAVRGSATELAPAAAGGSVREQAQAVPQQVGQDVQRALQQGAASRAGDP